MLPSTGTMNGSDSTGLLFPTVLDPPRKAMRMVPRRNPLLTSRLPPTTTKEGITSNGVSSSLNISHNSSSVGSSSSSSSPDIPTILSTSSRSTAIGQPVPKNKNIMMNHHHQHHASTMTSASSSVLSTNHHPHSNSHIPEELRTAVLSFNDTVTKEQDLPRAISVLRNALSSSSNGITTPTSGLASVSSLVDGTIIPTLRQVLQQYIDEQSGTKSPSSAPPLLVPSVSADLAFDCLLCLVNIGAGDNMIIRLLLKHNVHSLCVNLLHTALQNSTTATATSSSFSSSSTELVETAIWLLGNIAGDGSGSREEIYKIQAIDIIIQWIAKELTYLGYFPFGVSSVASNTNASSHNSSTAPSVDSSTSSVPIEIEYTSSLLKIATWTISNLCEGDNNNDGFVISDIANLLAVLNVCLDCPDFEVLSHACWSLSHLADGPPEHLHDVLCTLTTTTNFPNTADKLNPVGHWMIQECVPNEDTEISNAPLPQANPQSLSSIRNTLVRYSNTSLKKRMKKNDNPDPNLAITDTGKDALTGAVTSSLYRYTLPCTAAKLVRLLRHDVPRVVKPALRCVGNIVCAESGVGVSDDEDDDDDDDDDNDLYPDTNNSNHRTNGHRSTIHNANHPPTNENDYTELMCSLGIVPQLRRLMEGSSREMLKEACWSMSNVAAGTTNQIQAVLDSGCLPRVVQLCQDPSTDAGVRAEAGWIVLNSTSCGTDQQVEQLVKAGVVHVLCHMLSDPGMGVMALEGLEKIVSAYEKLVHGTTPSSAIANTISPSSSASSSPTAALTGANDTSESSKEKETVTKKSANGNKNTAKPLSFLPPGPIDTGSTANTKGSKGSNNGNNSNGNKQGTNSTTVPGYPMHPSMVGNNGPLTLVSALATAITSAFDIITSGNKTSSPTGNNTVRVLDDAVLSDAKYLLETFRTELLTQSNNGMVSNYFGNKDGNGKENSIGNGGNNNSGNNTLGGTGSNNKTNGTPSGESALRRVSKLWTDHFVTCGLCRRTWARTSNQTQYCEECRCDVCNECDCTIYHLSYQLELLGSDEEKTTKDKGKNKKDKNKEKNKDKEKNKHTASSAPATNSAAPIPSSSNDKKEKEKEKGGNSKTLTVKETPSSSNPPAAVDTPDNNEGEDTIVSQLKNAPKTVRRAMQATFGPTGTSATITATTNNGSTGTTNTSTTEAASPNNNSSEWHAVTKPNPSTKSKRRDLTNASEPANASSSTSNASTKSSNTNASSNHNNSSNNHHTGIKVATSANTTVTASKSSTANNSTPSIAKSTVSAVPSSSSSVSSAAAVSSVNPQSPWGKGKSATSSSTPLTNPNNAQFPSLSSSTNGSVSSNNHSTSGPKPSISSTAVAPVPVAVPTPHSANSSFIPDPNSISLTIPLAETSSRETHPPDLPPKGSNRTWKTVVSGKQTTNASNSTVESNPSHDPHSTNTNNRPDRKVSYSSVMSGKSGGSNSTGPNSPSMKPSNHSGTLNEIPSLDTVAANNNGTNAPNSGTGSSGNLGPAWKGRIPVTVKPIVPEKPNHTKGNSSTDNGNPDSNDSNDTNTYASNGFFSMDNSDLAQAQQLFLGTMSSLLQSAVQQQQQQQHPQLGSNPNSLFNPADMNSSLLRSANPSIPHGMAPNPNGFPFTPNPPYPTNNGTATNSMFGNNNAGLSAVTMNSTYGPLRSPMNNNNLMNNSMNTSYGNNSVLPPLPPPSMNNSLYTKPGMNNNPTMNNANPPLPSTTTAATVPHSFLIPASTNYISSTGSNGISLPLPPGSLPNPSPTGNISFMAGVHMPAVPNNNSTTVNPSSTLMESVLPFGNGSNNNTHMTTSSTTNGAMNPLGLTQEAFMALFTQAMNDAGITIGGGTDLPPHPPHDYGTDHPQNYGYHNNNNNNNYEQNNRYGSNYNNNSQRKLRSRGESMHDNSMGSGNNNGNPLSTYSNGNRPRSSSSRWQSNNNGSHPPPLTLDSFIRTEASRKLSSHNSSIRGDDENDDDDDTTHPSNDTSMTTEQNSNDPLSQPHLNASSPSSASLLSTGSSYPPLSLPHPSNASQDSSFNYNSVSSMGNVSTASSMGGSTSSMRFNNLFNPNANTASNNGGGLFMTNSTHDLNGNNNNNNNGGVNLDVVFGSHNNANSSSFLQALSSSGIFTPSPHTSTGSTVSSASSLLNHHPPSNSFINSLDSVFGPTGSTLSSSSSLSNDSLLPTGSTASLSNAFASPFSLSGFHHTTPTAAVSTATNNTNGSTGNMWSVHSKSPSLGSVTPSLGPSLDVLRSNFSLNDNGTNTKNIPHTLPFGALLGSGNGSAGTTHTNNHTNLAINRLTTNMSSSSAISPDRSITNDSIGFDLNTLGLMDELPDTPNPSASVTSLGILGGSSSMGSTTTTTSSTLFGNSSSASAVHQQQQQQLLQQDTEDILKSVMNFTNSMME